MTRALRKLIHLLLMPAIFWSATLLLAEPSMNELRKNAETCEGKAQWLLAWAYHKTGLLTIKGYKEESEKRFIQAADTIVKLAQQGDPEAQYMLGVMYAQGLGISSSRVKSMKWFRSAAENNNIPATIALGSMYRYGDWVPNDLVEAARYETKGATLLLKLADQGDADSMYELAKLYMKGIGVTRSDDEALKWLRMAGEHDDFNAEKDLGGLYLKGWYLPSDFGEIKIEQDFAKALQWYSKAAHTIQKAAENGDVDAQYRLGSIYERIAASEKHLTGSDASLSDYREAAFWYMKAAYHGHCSAQYSLYWAYSSPFPVGIKKDEVEGMAWKIIEVASEKDLDAPGLEDSVDEMRRNELSIGADKMRLAKQRSEDIASEIRASMASTPTGQR
jgi:TPR repeat protein